MSTATRTSGQSTNSSCQNTLTCDPNGANTCEETTEKSYSVSVGFEFGAAAPEEYWVSGGFSVQETWGDSDSQTCGSGVGGNTCVWYSTAYTQVSENLQREIFFRLADSAPKYTVQYQYMTKCADTTRDVGGPVPIKSPNKNNAGGKGFYCVVGTCRGKDQGYWHGGK